MVCASRENIPEYRETYVRVPLEELGRRDSKGIYSTAEIPEAPDLCAGAARNTGAVISGTKAESLETLAPLLRNGRVLPQVRFSVKDQMFVQPMLERVTTGAVGALRSTWSSR